MRKIVTVPAAPVIKNNIDIATAAGFASFKQLGEPGDAMLKRLVRDEGLKVMQIGGRNYYHAETARRMLASRRQELPEGWVQIREYAIKTNRDPHLARNAAKKGKIKALRVAVDGKKAAWYADPKVIDHVYSTKNPIPKGFQKKPAQTDASPGFEVDLVATVSRLEAVVLRQEVVIGNLASLVAQLADVLGVSAPTN